MIELNNVSYIYGEGSPYESIALRDINNRTYRKRKKHSCKYYGRYCKAD